MDQPSPVHPDHIDRPRQSSRIEALFRTRVAAFEMAGTTLTGVLSPEELSSVANAVLRRREEFAAGRMCARSALAEYGCGTAALCVGADRRPLWPEHMTGSISHTAGLCCAVVGSRSDAAAIGVDAQVVCEVTEDVWESICTAGELRTLRKSAPAVRQSRAALAFAAKEAFFKAQYELTGAWVDFHDIGIDASNGAFTVRALSAATASLGRDRDLVGRYFLDRGLVVCGMDFPACERR